MAHDDDTDPSPTFRIPRHALEALLEAASSDQSRASIAGLIFHEDAVAVTDGHRMLVCRLQGAPHVPEPILVNRAGFERAFACMRPPHCDRDGYVELPADVVDVVLDPDAPHVAVGEATVDLTGFIRAPLEPPPLLKTLADFLAAAKKGEPVRSIGIDSRYLQVLGTLTAYRDTEAVWVMPNDQRDPVIVQVEDRHSDITWHYVIMPKVPRDAL